MLNSHEAMLGANSSRSKVTVALIHVPEEARSHITTRSAGFSTHWAIDHRH
jgi:hypothetical protein